MKKYSRQRELIYKSLKNRIDHPTAEKLYLDLKEQMPEIGIATVYRNLNELWEQGEIIKVKSKMGPDRFDGNIMPHIHFQCEKCQEIYDIFLEENAMRNLDNEMKELAEKIGGKLKSSEISMTGICHNCQSKK